MRPQNLKTTNEQPPTQVDAVISVLLRMESIMGVLVFFSCFSSNCFMSAVNVTQLSSYALKCLDLNCPSKIDNHK